MATIEENKQEYLELCSKIKRDGIQDLVHWLEKSDFFTAPASKAYHGAYRGGLLQHSLNVYHELVRIMQVYPEVVVPEESVLISSLFHDLCKVNFYGTEKRNRKNEQGKWESYDAYNITEKFPFGGHGSKSVFIVQSFIKLTPEEAVAINCHMGAFGDNSTYISNSYIAFPFAWLVSVADQSASYLVEGGE